MEAESFRADGRTDKYDLADKSLFSLLRRRVKTTTSLRGSRVCVGASECHRKLDRGLLTYCLT